MKSSLLGLCNTAVHGRFLAVPGDFARISMAFGQKRHEVLDKDIVVHTL